MILDHNKILSEIVMGNINWSEISRMTMDEEDAEEFKKYLDWRRVIYRNNFSLDFIMKMIDEGYIDFKNMKSMLVDIFQQNTDKKEFLNFIKKYKDNFDIPYVLERTNLKKSEALKIFGKPEIGSGFTGFYGSDCYPFTVIESNPKGLEIVVQADNSIPVENFNYFSNQKYTFSENKNGDTFTLKLNSSGKWTYHGIIFMPGRERYSNPSF